MINYLCSNKYNIQNRQIYTIFTKLFQKLGAINVICLEAFFWL